MTSAGGLIGDFFGGPGTGALGGPPTGHNYKRAVYRPPPKQFYAEVLPPTKMGSGFCYGLRICPINVEESDARSTRSGPSMQEYEIWRRWEDCLWFQEILESEYALMARQKRARLQAGKGVKKNGVYIHSDEAASFESLPPGPDANSIAKDIHDHVPRLNKKGTLFRPSQATIEQRGQEFQALMQSLFQDEVPMLIQELRDTRLVRDFFGYWRRDLDHDRKRQSLCVKDKPNARQSVSSSAFSMYFNPSNISLQLPNNYADVPPTPALPNFASSPLAHDISRRNSVQPEEARRRSTGPGPNYATSDSSSSSISVSSSSHGMPNSLPTSPNDLTFYVSTRGSLALSLAQDDDDARAEYINTPLSAPARVQAPPPWSRDSDRPFPSQDEEILLPDLVKTRADAGTAPGDFHPGLQALPEDGELEPVPIPVPNPHSEIEEVPRVPARRVRNNSCPDRTNRQCIVFPPDAPHSAQVGGGFAMGEDMRLRQSQNQPRADRPVSRDGAVATAYSSGSSSGRSSHPPSSFATDAPSSRSSWRTSMMSELSMAPSFATSFANGSCADFDRQSRISFTTSFADGSCADLGERPPRDPRLSVASFASVSTSGGRQTALGHRGSMATLSSFLSDLSIDSSAFSRVLTPSPPSGTGLRRSLSAGSRRPPSIMAALGGQEDWYEHPEDFIDAYFYDPGMHASNTMPAIRPQTPPSRMQPQEPEKDGERDLEYRASAALQPLPFHLEVSSPDRFPKPFRNRPPGQFHLPWTPPATPGPESYRALPESQPTSPATAPGEHVTLKAVLNESIVLLRVPRAAPLSEVRQRLRDKFAAQEGVQLSSAFVVGWAPVAGAGGATLRGRPRANSASSVGMLNPQALRYVYTEQEWAAALAACGGGKMTIRLFNAQAI